MSIEREHLEAALAEAQASTSEASDGDAAPEGDK